jgi:hypothetical protein
MSKQTAFCVATLMICFTPQSVPLSWTMDLRELDRDRVKP